MKYFPLIAVAAFLSFAGGQVALADDCSGRDHDTGTALGAVGGAAIGGLTSHSVVGAVVGGVVGGVAGNAIARNNDCNRVERRADARDAYEQGYADRAAEDRAENRPIENQAAEDRVAADQAEDRAADAEARAAIAPPRPLHDDSEGDEYR